MALAVLCPLAAGVFTAGLAIAAGVAGRRRNRW